MSDTTAGFKTFAISEPTDISMGVLDYSRRIRPVDADSPIKGKLATFTFFAIHTRKSDGYKRHYIGSAQHAFAS